MGHHVALRQCLRHFGSKSVSWATAISKYKACLGYNNNLHCWAILVMQAEEYSLEGCSERGVAHSRGPKGDAAHICSRPLHCCPSCSQCSHRACCTEAHTHNPSWVDITCAHRLIFSCTHRWQLVICSMIAGDIKVAACTAEKASALL